MILLYFKLYQVNGGGVLYKNIWGNAPTESRCRQCVCGDPRQSPAGKSFWRIVSFCHIRGARPRFGGNFPLPQRRTAPKCKNKMYYDVANYSCHVHAPPISTAMCFILSSFMDCCTSLACRVDNVGLDKITRWPC